ncbi:MAG: phosphoethanolamine transferase [Phascolarctobacterium succinatutens]|uniref:phosphoethanolamine transferase n=1 Tax=Phascolarctobacterium succinatutens TaxID=626940 RepID=UPI002E769580|nr:phosphoethanolamine transferase [Phascolarctobacterium succinatutens]MEE0357740.1 phosphoethanolamine transferase [Phascolarctobacterium succinatutens]
MFSSALKKEIRTIVITSVIVYCILMLFACGISGDYTLRHSNGIILSSVGIALASKVYIERKVYFCQISLLFLLANSIFLIKLVLGNFIGLSSVKNYANFSIALLNLALLLPMLFEKHVIRSVLRFIFLAVILLPVFVILGYYSVTSTVFAPDTLLAIAQTNIQEAIEYAKDNFSCKTIFLIILANASVFFVAIKNTQKILWNKYNLFLVLFCITACLVGVYKYRDNIITDIPKQASKTLAQYKNFSKERTDRKDNMSKLLLSHKPEAGVYVLVIGESQNRAHMQAYNYHRATTPWLDSMKNDKNMLLFTKAYSCHTHTVPTLLYALTAKNQYNNIAVKNAVSVLEVAEAAGFETVWLSNKVKYSAWDTPVTSIASEANQQKWINSTLGESTNTDYFDGKLIEELEKIKITDKMLIVMHLMGNHGSYEQRYPKAFEKYDGKNTIDKYDNSIIYNDYVMSQVYKRARKIPNFKGLVYCSDHADAIDKNLLHDAAQFDFDMTHIPLYIYLSDSYIQNNSAKYKSLEKQKNKLFTNDLLFNLMLGVLGINLNNIYEPNNDPTADTFDNNKERFKTLYGKKYICEEKL